VFSEVIAKDRIAVRAGGSAGVGQRENASRQLLSVQSAVGWRHIEVQDATPVMGQNPEIRKGPGSGWWARVKKSIEEQLLGMVSRKVRQV